MSTHHPFRFGAVFTGAYTGAEWREHPRRLEDAGFSSLLVADHLMNPMACVPLMTAAAAVTSTLRIGSYVACNDFRSPVMLAKEAATIDVLSDGRFELGFGAGWAKVEYVASGLDFDSPKVRADRFCEAVAVVKQLLAGETVEHEGEYYRLHEMPGMPMPVQQPIPLMIGGGGPRMLRFAAREAAIVSFVPQSLQDGGLNPEAFKAESFDARMRDLDAAVAAASRADGGPERNMLVFAFGDDTELPGLSPDDVAASPFVLPADPNAIEQRLYEIRERWGISYVVCFDHDIDAVLPVVPRLTGR